MKTTTTDTQVALESAMQRLNKAYGSSAIMRLGESAISEPIEVIPTGSLGLDLAMGVGGYPKGRIIEIFGPEMSGKTTLSLSAIANAQRLGQVAAFIDAEHSLNPGYAKILGVDTDNLLISQPNSGEEALEIVDTLVQTGGVGLIVVDSVAALVPKAELSGEMGDSHIGLQARLMSQAMRKLTAAMDQSRTTVIFINQLREKVGVMFGSPEVTSGGRALKFYASIRLDVRRVEAIKEGGTEVVGNKIKVKVVKNKVSAPFRDTVFPLIYAQGIDYFGELLELGERRGLITRTAQGRYSAGDIQLGFASKAKAYLVTEPGFAKKLELAIREKRDALETESGEVQLTPEAEADVSIAL